MQTLKQPQYPTPKLNTTPNLVPANLYARQEVVDFDENQSEVHINFTVAFETGVEVHEFEERLLRPGRERELPLIAM